MDVIIGIISIFVIALVLWALFQQSDAQEKQFGASGDLIDLPCRNCGHSLARGYRYGSSTNPLVPFEYCPNKKCGKSPLEKEEREYLEGFAKKIAAKKIAAKKLDRDDRIKAWAECLASDPQYVALFNKYKDTDNLEDFDRFVNGKVFYAESEMAGWALVEQLFPDPKIHSTPSIYKWY